jgi:tyrosyl-tRNA synthetase
LHELFYPLLQGFDSVQVEADIEIGGSDQRFNILMGRQLQPQFGQKPQLAVLLPLLVGCDGERKMSKSLGNAIGLTDNPDDMFAKVMGLGDSLIVPFTELASSAGRAQVEAVKAELLAGGNPKISKENLAVRLVTEFHGAAAAQAARNEWNRVHSKRELPADMKNHELAQATEVARVLKDSGLAPSVNQARRLIEGGGVRLDGVKVEAVNQVLAVPPPAGQVLQVGRRLFVRLIPAAAV